MADVAATAKSAAVSTRSTCAPNDTGVAFASRMAESSSSGAKSPSGPISQPTEPVKPAAHQSSRSAPASRVSPVSAPTSRRPSKACIDRRAPAQSSGASTCMIQPEPDCRSADSAIRCQRSDFSPEAGRATARADTIGTRRATPSSAAFSTSQSIRFCFATHWKSVMGTTGRGRVSTPPCGWHVTPRFPTESTIASRRRPRPSRIVSASPGATRSTEARWRDSASPRVKASSPSRFSVAAIAVCMAS